MKTSTVVDLDLSDLLETLVTRVCEGKPRPHVCITPGDHNHPDEDEGERFDPESWQSAIVSFTVSRKDFVQLIQSRAGDHLRPEQRTGSSEVNIRLTEKGAFAGASIRFQLNGKP